MKLAKIAFIGVGLAAIVFISFWAGSFSKLFELNLCYSQVISQVGKEADEAYSSESPEQIAAFKALVRELPLHGYETECKEVASTMLIYKAQHVVP